jgi:hypothetical protein
MPPRLIERLGMAIRIITVDRASEDHWAYAKRNLWRGGSGQDTRPGESGWRRGLSEAVLIARMVADGRSEREVPIRGATGRLPGPTAEVRYSEFALATQSPVFKVPAQIERAFVDRVRVRISWADLALDQLSAALDDGAEEPRRYDEDHRVRVPASVVLRRGSARFRRTLLDAYDGRCAVTGTWIHGLLEAAHITPQRAGA